MNDNLELKNHETYVLTHIRFSNYRVLIFTDLNSPHQEIEILMSFYYLHLFRSKKGEIFLFKSEDKKYIHVGEKLFSFETNDEIVKYS